MFSWISLKDLLSSSLKTVGGHIGGTAVSHGAYRERLNSKATLSVLEEAKPLEVASRMPLASVISYLVCCYGVLTVFVTV